MTTARLAFSYDRDVFALPGRSDDVRSQGCNRLIREKIAEPITSTQELIASLGFKIQSRKESRENDLEMLERAYSSDTSNDSINQMASILLAIRRNRGITIEEIAEKTSLGYVRTAELARLLETDGFISIDLLQRCTINVRNYM